MQDIIALLQNLTIPAGAISGARIVLDGSTGTLSVYGSNDKLLMTLDGNGFKVYDATGLARTKIGIPGQFSTIILETGHTGETTGPLIDSLSVTGETLLTLQSGIEGKGSNNLNLVSPDSNATPHILQWITGFITGGLSPPIVDFCGDVGTEARVVLDDLWHGSGNGNGNAPTSLVRIGQGLIPGTTSGDVTSNVTGSATVGTVVDIVALLGVPVRNGFKYRCVAKGYTAVSTNNAAATNQWDIGIDVDAGAGRNAIGGYKFNANVGGNDIRVGVPTIEGDFVAAADGTIDIRATITKVVGANTSFLTTNNDSTHPFSVRCYHVG